MLDEKNSMESRSQVNFLEHDTDKMRKILKQQQDAFLEFNNGSPVAFLPSAKIEEFLQNTMSYYNDSLKLSEKEREEAHERARKDGFFGNDIKSEVDFSQDVESGLVFFNPKSGIEIAMGVNSVFPLSDNAFFDESKSQDDIVHVLISDEFSTELAQYCIEQGKDKLPFFKKGLGALYLYDIDFLLRFWKSDEYHTKPEITLTRQMN